MNTTDTYNALVVDIYSLCESLQDSNPVSIVPIKLDKDKSDFKSTWLVKVNGLKSGTMAIYLDNLSEYEVEHKLEIPLCPILYGKD